MQIPSVIFLGLFTLFAIFWVTFSGFNIYHAMKFGIRGIANELTLVIYVAVSVVFAGIASGIIFSTDWSLPIEVILSL